MIDMLAVFIGFLAVLVAGAVYLGENRRTDLDVARSLHLDLTSGEVAEARRLLGTLRYGAPADREAVGTGDALTAYFTVLWAFERIAAGRRSMVHGQLLGRQARAVRFLDECIRWHLHEWREGLPIAKAALGERLAEPISDDQSRDALRELLQSQGLPPLTDETSSGRVRATLS